MDFEDDGLNPPSKFCRGYSENIHLTAQLHLMQSNNTTIENLLSINCTENICKSPNLAKFFPTRKLQYIANQHQAPEFSHPSY